MWWSKTAQRANSPTAVLWNPTDRKGGSSYRMLNDEEMYAAISYFADYNKTSFLTWFLLCLYTYQLLSLLKTYICFQRWSRLVHIWSKNSLMKQDCKTAVKPLGLYLT